jgi:predicted Zn finger-like uncharacterized protein
MSLATRCPHCDTIFKVVQDQLKVSEGWVRCGRCNEVFNALEGLFDMEREAPPQRSRPVPAAPTPSPEAEAPLAEPVAEQLPSVSPSQAAEPAFTPATPESPAPEQPLASPLEPAAIFETTTPPPASSWPDPEDEIDSFKVSEQPEQVGAVTSFDLDLPPSQSAPLPVQAASLSPPAAPEVPAHALPVTDESDALDSRYLLTTDQAQRPRRRGTRRGPDFADAQFPADLVEDPLGWDTDWAASDLQDTAAPTVPGAPLTQASPPANEREPSMGSLLSHAAQDSGPATLPSRFESDYQPEQPLPPPSQRKGRSGTRGRLPQPPAPEFIQQAERKAIWRHPVVRGVLGVVALLLSLLLAAQTAHHWRDQLASRYPQAKPWLAQWCQVAGCKLAPPLGLEDLQVDNIAVVKTSSEGDDTYRMTVIIHNKGEVALAWPHVDITLTNPSGEVVARRAFDARTAQQIPNGAEPAASAATSAVPEAVPPNASTTLQWQLRAPDLHLASYTAELFYP